MFSDVEIKHKKRQHSLEIWNRQLSKAGKRKNSI